MKKITILQKTNVVFKPTNVANIWKAVLTLILLIGLTIGSVSAQTMYTMTINATPGGWVSPSATLSQPAGAQVNLVATANTGYTFLKWTGDVTGTSASIYVTQAAKNMVITAVFAYNLTVAISPSGAGTVTGGGYYAGGATATLTATPAAGYTFSGYTGDLTSSSNPSPVTMSTDKSVTANFITTPSLWQITSPGNYSSIFYNVTNGKVGIGKTNPSVPLDVNGAINASGNISAGSFTTAGTINATGAITANKFVGDGTSLTGMPWTLNGSDISYTGNLAIPKDKWLTLGDVNASGKLGFAWSETYKMALTDFKYNLYYRGASGTPLVLQSNGSAAIGIDVNYTTPNYDHANGYKLFVNGTINSNSDITSGNGTINTMLSYSSSSTGGVVGTKSNHPLFICTNSTTQMTIDGSGKVGIGTNTPGAKLDILTDHTSQIPIRITHNNYNDWVLQKRRTDNTQLFGIKEENSDGSMGFATAGVTRMVIDRLGHVGIGTPTPQTALHVNGDLRVDGTIFHRGILKSQEINVEVPNGTWKDYVFAPSYRLKSLREVEQFIQSNGHLPEIPSAKEVEQNGISVGDMQAKLLQKVEELTLYVIEQDKMIKAQAKEIEALKKK